MQAESIPEKRGLPSQTISEIAHSLSLHRLTYRNYACFTGRVPDTAATMRPCPNGCGYQITFHPTHCCNFCAFGLCHGWLCERKPIPEQRFDVADIVGQAQQQSDLTEKTCEDGGKNLEDDTEPQSVEPQRGDPQEFNAIGFPECSPESPSRQCSPWSAESLLTKTSKEIEQGDLVTKIAGRGFTLGAALEFLCVLLDSQRAFSEIDGLKDAYHAYGNMPEDLHFEFPWFSPETTKTWEVTYRAIVPLSFYRRSAFSDVLSGRNQCFPKNMVSHSWGNIFVHTLAACVARVKGRQFFFHLLPQMRTFDGVRAMMTQLGEYALLTTFWLCSFSVNQHRVGCDSSPWPCMCGLPKVLVGPKSEIGVFDTMMHLLKKIHPDFSQVIALDRETDFECHVDSDISLNFLRNSRARILSCMPEVEGSLTRHATRLLLVGDQIENIDDEVDPLTTTRRIKVRRVCSVLTRVWVVAEIAEAFHREITQHAIGHFPLLMSGPEFLRRLQAVDVLTSEASDPADLQMVLNHVRKRGSIEECNHTLRQVLSKKPISTVALNVVFLLASTGGCGSFLLMKDYSKYHLSLLICICLTIFVELHALTFHRERQFLQDGLLNDSRLSKELREARHIEMHEYITNSRWYGERLHTWSYNSWTVKRWVYMVMRFLPTITFSVFIQLAIVSKCKDALHGADAVGVCNHSRTVVIAKSAQILYLLIMPFVSFEFRNSLAHMLAIMPPSVKTSIVLGSLVFFVDAYVDMALLIYSLSMFCTYSFLSITSLFIRLPWDY